MPSVPSRGRLCSVQGVALQGVGLVRPGLARVVRVVRVEVVHDEGVVAWARGGRDCHKHAGRDDEVSKG